jgi:hypothetical protein
MTNLLMRILLSLTCLALLGLSACQKAEEPAPAAKHQSEAALAETWEQFVTRQIEAHINAHPQWAVVQGRHEYDGQLPDWSRAGIEKEIRRLHQQRDEAMAFADDQMTPEQLYQREYLISRVDQDLFWMEKAGLPFRSPQFYFGWMSDSLDPSPYIALDYASLEQRMRSFTLYLKNVPLAITQIRENLAMPMPRTWLQLGIDGFGGYAEYFRDDVPAVWAGVEDEDLQQEFASANAEAIQAMQDITDWLKSNLPTATEDFALGPDLFREMLWDTERVDISLEELEAIGRADMARNLQNLKDACAEFAPGSSLQDCFAKMSDNKPKVDSVESARDQLQEIRQFMVQEDLVSIPGSEEAKVDEAPPYQRSNSAYINIPGAWEKNQPSVYYISPPNPAWPEDVQADYIAGEADLLFTSVHEVWPGHFLNFLHANRAPFFYGRVFVGYAFAEGWAHYTEEMMLEAGLRDGDPETRIGQISNALLRNARFLSTIGLHTRGWSVEDSKRFFMEEGFQSEGTAIQQAARGTYDPAYLNYTMGKLMIKRLRDDWTATRGGRTAWREFHDTFLSYGGPPIPLVRMQMMGETEPEALFPAH